MLVTHVLMNKDLHHL